MGVQHGSIIAPTMPGMRWIELFAAVLAACLGLAGIGVLLLGPSAGGASFSIDPGTTAPATASSVSLLEAGVPPFLAFQLACAAIGLGVLVAGAWLHARGDRQARRLVAGSALVVAAVTVLNPSALPYLLPGAGVAVLAAMIALAPEGRRGSA